MSDVIEHGDAYLCSLNGRVFKEDISSNERAGLQSSSGRTAAVAFADHVVRATLRDVEDDADHLQSVRIRRPSRRGVHLEKPHQLSLVVISSILVKVSIVFVHEN